MALSSSKSKVIYLILVVGVFSIIIHSMVSGLGVLPPSLSQNPNLRRVNIEEIIKRIHEGRLSDHEARFYRPIK